MKKNNLTVKERLTLSKIIHKKNKRKQRKQRKPTQKQKTTVDSTQKSQRTITIPETFCLYNNQEETLKTIQTIASSVHKKTLQKVDFGAVKELDHSTSLVLASEMEAWKKNCPALGPYQPKKWDTKIKQLLNDIGFFELLGLDKISNNPNNVDKKFFKFKSGIEVDGEKAREIRKEIEDSIGKSIGEKNYLFEAITEACTNTKQHAYNDDSLLNKWWLSASFEPKSETIKITVFDRGLGIPRTVERWGLYENLKSKLWDGQLGAWIKDHSKIIQSAVELSYENSLQSDTKQKTRTRTNQENRGKGLYNMIELVKESGELKIISYRGFCVFQIQQGQLRTTHREELKIPLRGTLIEWSFSVENS